MRVIIEMRVAGRRVIIEIYVSCGTTRNDLSAPAEDWLT